MAGGQVAWEILRTGWLNIIVVVVVEMICSDGERIRESG